jgi:hypothetical protein
MKRRDFVLMALAIASLTGCSKKANLHLSHHHRLRAWQIRGDHLWIENQIRPIALGRKNWLFAGSLRAGKRAAAIMSLIQSAKLNGHEPLA